MKYHKILLLLILSMHPLFGIKHIVLISAPGSGKDTMAQHLALNHNYIHISMRKLWDNEINNKTELGIAIINFIESGQQSAPNAISLGTINLAINLIEKCIIEKRYFILDAIRSISAANKFFEFFKKNNLQKEISVIQLATSDQACIERVSFRQTCKGCSHVYNTQTNAPQIPLQCDTCHVELSCRKDDSKEAIEKRLADFHKRIEPIIKQLKGRYEISHINSERPLDELLNNYNLLAKN